MNGLKALYSFLKSESLIKYANIIKKIAIEIEEEEIVEAVKKAERERNRLKLFDYSDLFEDGKNYVILPDEKPQDDEIDLSEIYNKAKTVHSEIGMDVSFEEYIEDPSVLKLFGESFSLDNNLNKIAIKIYTALVLPKIRKIFKENFPLVESILKTNPISYLQSQDISTSFELNRDIVDSSLFLSMPSEIVKNINIDKDNFEFTIDESQIESESEKSKYEINDICKKIEQLIDLSNTIFLSKSSISSHSKINQYSYLFETLKVVISYDANDIATATYKKDCNGTSWSSCKNILVSEDILKDVVEGGLVAYLVNADDPYPVKDPLARVRIRHYSPDNRDEKDFVLMSEDRVYGEVSSYEKSYFLNIVKLWVLKANGLIENSYGVYNLSGDEDTDTLPNVTGPSSFTKYYDFDIRGKVFRIGDAKNIKEKEILEGAYENKSLAMRLAIGLTGINFENGSLGELTKGVPGYILDSAFSINHNNVEADSASIALLSKLLKTAAGRNLQYKSTAGTLDKKDLSKFIKSLSNFFNIIFSKEVCKSISGNGSGDGAEQVYTILELVFQKFDEYTTGKTILSLFENEQDKNYFIDNEIINIVSPIISDIPDNDAELLEGRVSAALSMTSYTGMPILERDNIKILNIIKNLDNKSFSNVGYSVLEYLGEYSREIFDDPKVKDLLKQEIDEYISSSGSSYFSEYHFFGDYDSLFKYMSKIKNSGIEGIDKGIVSLIVDISKRGINDEGFIGEDTLESAIDYLSAISKISKEKILDYYNLINIKDYSFSLKRNLVIKGKNSGFFFKKKVSMGGLLSKYEIMKSPMANSYEDAVIMAKHYGVDESWIKEDNWSRGNFKLKNPV